MGLHTDSIFIAALAGNSALMETIGGRLYGTAIPLPDEDLDNVPVPYVIVTYDGLVNEGLTKDDSFEGNTDTVTIGIEMTASTLDALHTLTESVRSIVSDYMANYEGADGPMDYQFSAGRIEWDQMKPCYWQAFSYVCSIDH